MALFSEGRIEWLVSELAILYVGAIAVPLSVKINEAEELKFRLEHSGCSIIFVSAQQVEKIRNIRDELAELKTVVLIEDSQEKNATELSYNALLSKGISVQPDLQAELTKRWTTLDKDDLANISYTSGTTADPKGIMLTHRNYTANLEQANSLFDVPEWYTSLLILSWDHSFAHTVGLYVMIKNGASISVVEAGKTPMESLRNIPKNIREVRPVFQLSVPAIARSFKKSIESGIKSKGGFTEKLFNRAMKTAYRYHGDGYSKKSPGQWVLRPLVALYDRILFSKIRENFGGRLKFFVGGGALLDIELQHFFYAIGIPMFQGYGLSEASPVISSNNPQVHKLGTSGKVVKNLELKILDDDGTICLSGKKGEIVVKGENVMRGYWKNKEATASALKDGWLHTGDLGFLDSDGFLHVLGRFKSLLIGNDGEKYSPEGIEEALVDYSSFIDQSMLYNNQNAYTSGLIVVNPGAIKSYLKKKNLDPKSDAGIEAAIQKVYTEIELFDTAGDDGQAFPKRWLPAAIAILDEPFTEENGMINSTLKMVRNKVATFFANRIDHLYTAEGKNPMNDLNKSAMHTILNQNK